jgi:NitT/TauT family transport system substrate-binding protein
MARGDVPERLGADVSWRLFGTGPAIVNAFEAGEIDLAYIGLPPALIGMDRGVPIKCIAGGHVEGTVISGKEVFGAYDDLQDLGEVLAQFRGMKIGVPGKGSIHDVILADCLEEQGLAGDIEVINYQWADQITEAMARDEVAAAVGTPALAVALKRFARAKVLYPPSRLKPNNPSYGIVADEAFLRKERGLVEDFLRLHEEATALLRHDPAGAAELISGYVGFIDTDFVLDALRVSPKYCAQITEDYVTSTLEFVGIMKKLGYIMGDIGKDKIFDASLINKIHPEKDHYGEGLSK